MQNKCLSVSVYLQSLTEFSRLLTQVHKCHMIELGEKHTCVSKCKIKSAHE